MNSTTAHGWCRLLVLAGIFCCVARNTSGVTPRQWVSGPDDLASATALQVAISSRGWISPAPELRQLGAPALPGDPPHIWALASDGRGGFFLGTGPDGRILRIAAGGEATEFHRVDEPLVTALALLAGGDLLAATAPGGRIYRISPDGKRRLWSQPDARYIWALHPGGEATFAASGGDGRVLRLDHSGAEQLFWDSEETHIVNLVAAPNGGWVAGSAPRGRLYALDQEGNAFALHDDALAEVTALVVEEDGGVVASLLEGARSRRGPPVVRLRVPGSAQVGAAEPGLEPGLEERDAPIVHGIIEGLPEPEDYPESITRGRVARLSRHGAVQELWRSTREGVFALARDGEGRILFGTGEPGRLYRIELDGDVNLLASFDEAQVTGLLGDDGGILVTTSNPGAAYRLMPSAASSGSLISMPIDAGAVARWGAIDWTLHGDPSTVTLSTRSGNIETPDESWSAWTTAKRGPGGGRVDNPEGRYLQWRLTFDKSAETSIAAIGVTYEPLNRTPEFGEFRRQPDRSSPDRLTFRWVGMDPDGDPLDILLEARESNGGEWREVARGMAPEGPRHEGAPLWDQGEIAWETHDVVEAEYELRAWLSDERANPAGEGRRAVHQRGQRVTIDRTPPRIAILGEAGAHLEVAVSDELSSVTRLELVVDGRVVRLIRPLDGLCDSRHERFRVERPTTSGTSTLRAHDAAGHSAESELPPP